MDDSGRGDGVGEFHRTAERQFLEAIGIPYPYVRPRQRLHSHIDEGKILVFSDPHEPFASEKVYHAGFLKEHDAGTLIIPGDLGDYYSKSRFRKTKPASFLTEVRSVFYRLEWFSTHWRKVKVMIGNHDSRSEKKIQDLFSSDTDLLILTEQNLLRHLAAYFDNIEVVGTQLDGTGINLSHIYQHGDIIFTHGEISRIQKTATLEYISNYLRRWKSTLGLKPYRILAQAHNHTDLKTRDGAEDWFLLPTASDPFSLAFDYIYTPRLVGRPPVRGYSIFRQEKGETDYNGSHNIVV